MKLISEIILHFVLTSYIVQNGWAHHTPGHVILSYGRYTRTQDVQLYHRADTPHPLSRNSYHRDDIAYLSTGTVIDDGYTTSLHIQRAGMSNPWPCHLS